ncbi:transposase [Stigmatella hybrida]|uniref:transposase n=1 Tax=Stigmatella hybrida TaxID=394097 RepID=UPI001CDAB0AE|nr:transposase [Stigmatella hybrida]
MEQCPSGRTDYEAQVPQASDVRTRQLRFAAASCPSRCVIHTKCGRATKSGQAQCRYGARGALALERLSRAEDGRIAYRMRRPLPKGTTHLFFTGLELLRRVASLVPPPKLNLIRFHGVFAPGAKLRPFLLPQEGAEKASEAPQAAARQETRKERTARVDWAGLLQRTFVLDVFACGRCGGRRRVLAYVKEAGGGRDSGALGPAHGRCEVGLGA